MAAASTSSASRTASRVCACRAAATAVPPRRRRSSTRSGRRSTRPLPICSASRSRAPSVSSRGRAESAGLSLPMVQAGPADPADGRRAVHRMSVGRGEVTGTGRLPSTLVAGLGRLARPAPVEEDGEVRGLREPDLRGPPPPARARRAAHPVRLRAVHRDASSGVENYCPVGTRTCGSTTSSSPTSCGRRSSCPSGLRSSCARPGTGTVVALYPSPAGATESELHLESWEQLVERNPILERARGRRRGARRQPHGRAAREHAIVPIDECYRLVGLIKSTWQGISGGNAISDAVPKFFEYVRRKAGVCMTDTTTPRSRGRPAQRDYGPEVTFEVLGAAHEPFAAQPTLRFELSASEPSDRADLRDLADRPDQLRSGAPRVRRRDARGPLRAVRRAGALAVDDAQLPVDARRARSCTPSPARSPSASRCRAPPIWRSSPSRYVVGAARRRCPADVPLHRTHPVRRAAKRQVQVVHLPWRHLGAVPHAGRGLEDMIKHHHGESGFALLHNDTLDGAQALQARARAAQLRRLRRGPARARAGRGRGAIG